MNGHLIISYTPFVPIVSHKLEGSIADDPSPSSKPYSIFILEKPANLSKLLVTMSFMRDDEESM